MPILRPRRFYCALAVSATIRVFLTKISNRIGIAVQWNGGGGVKNLEKRTTYLVRVCVTVKMEVETCTAL